MKRPKPKNTPIDNRRIRAWTSDFAGYRQQIGEYAIASWLEQFDEDDRDLAQLPQFVEGFDDFRTDHRWK